MDGEGRAIDNVFTESLWRSLKYENVFIKGYETMGEANLGIGDYLQFYNKERLHASHGYSTPDQVYSLESETTFITVGKNALKKAVCDFYLTISTSYFANLICLAIPS